MDNRLAGSEVIPRFSQYIVFNNLFFLQREKAVSGGAEVVGGGSAGKMRALSEVWLWVWERCCRGTAGRSGGRNKRLFYTIRGYRVPGRSGGIGMDVRGYRVAGRERYWLPQVAAPEIIVAFYDSGLYSGRYPVFQVIV